MKDLENTKKIFRAVIDRNRREYFNHNTMCLFKVIRKFGMKDSKHVKVPLAAYMSLSSAQSHKNETEMKEIKNIPYANA